ncbi:MAG: hypothetical protein QF664_06880 [Dehalococcoidia bacterium]|jgi:hypothetical protein|nr:hypothetical protein [Dehalococcoidia bacterium]
MTEVLGDMPGGHQQHVTPVHILASLMGASTAEVPGRDRRQRLDDLHAQLSPLLLQLDRRPGVAANSASRSRTDGWRSQTTVRTLSHTFASMWVTST